MLPEELYQMTLLDYTKTPLKTGVVGTVIRYDDRKRAAVVDLGCGFRGVIPEREITVYPFTYSGEYKIANQILAIIGRKIRAIVTGIAEDGILILSRRLSMEEAWNSLEENSNVLARIVGITQKNIFLDIGNGLRSRNVPYECTGTLINDLNHWFELYSYIPVRIISKGQECSDKIVSSHRLVYPDYNTSKKMYKEGQIISVRIGDRVNEEGYFCEVTPAIRGIIDTRETLKEGQRARAIVRKLTDKGIRMDKI